MSQVAKLEELLTRIQRNRRGEPGSTAAAPSATPVARARKQTGPTPLERAVEDQLRAPTSEPVATAPAAAPAAPPLAAERPAARAPEPPSTEPLIDRPPASVPAAPSAPVAPMPPPPAVASPRPAPATRAALKPASVAPPSAPIVTTTGQIEPAAPFTFGDLLDRTLRLRPR